MLARSQRGNCLRAFQAAPAWEVSFQSFVQLEDMELEVDHACSRVEQVHLRLMPAASPCVLGPCRGRLAIRIALPSKILSGCPGMLTVHQTLPPVQQVPSQDSLEEFAEMYMRRLRGGHEAMICEGCLPTVPGKTSIP